jgi:lipooligosaccharide transport system permease protein
MRFGIVPMFLFAGAFYPVEQLPGWLQPLAQATPLYHGVELCRGSVLHTLGIVDAAVHVAVLAAYWFVGLWCSIRIFARRLAE